MKTFNEFLNESTSDEPEGVDKAREWIRHNIPKTIPGELPKMHVSRDMAGQWSFGFSVITKTRKVTAGRTNPRTPRLDFKCFLTDDRKDLRSVFVNIMPDVPKNRDPHLGDKIHKMSMELKRKGRNITDADLDKAFRFIKDIEDEL